MKKLCLAIVALLPLTAVAYPVELSKQLNGAEISATTQDVDSNIGAVILYNYGEADATCTAVFRNGPEAPRTRRTDVKAGATTNLTSRFGRNIIKLRIELTCEPK
ncbi:3-phosphoglycerate kinase [Aquipseudomonas ullengensis]|uniref:3-phosphoglycerate kinase n=1 Tax=Aquipseudomonas ullengensis TaxID=2759166 RepID=A0A7W4LP54_9GAMM|nr:3-phosphoglycerate kinase [Pseudomonas ullengensis]MBB2496595.1 3-phosphoglycerate kinase [Pseudomonas ullengensis]